MWMARILLVEDDTSNRDMIDRRLCFEGYQVITAANGAQAVALAGSEKPDLILMDMDLPVLSGWQATHRIKSGPETHMIPIIALTAYVLSDDRERCLNVGCDEYESKPIEFASLFKKMQTLLNAQSKSAAA
jgi:two-component system cell cycle response regulator DivK